jgi:hypothetical protein
MRAVQCFTSSHGRKTFKPSHGRCYYGYSWVISSLHEGSAGVFESRRGAQVDDCVLGVGVNRERRHPVLRWRTPCTHPFWFLIGLTYVIQGAWIDRKDDRQEERVMRECSELCEVHHRNSSSSCMYIYVCIYTYIYVFCLYVCICIFSCLYMSCVYKCIYTYVLVDTYGVLYICMYTLILLQACGGRALISAWSTALK